VAVACGSVVGGGGIARDVGAASCAGSRCAARVAIAAQACVGCQTVFSARCRVYIYSHPTHLRGDDR